MLNYNIYKKLQNSLIEFEKLNKNINESYEIKDVRVVSSFTEPDKKLRGKKKDIENEEYLKNIIKIKGSAENYSTMRKNIISTISPIYNIYITQHTKDQLKKRSNTHGPDTPLISIESILPYITRLLLTGGLRPNSKFAYYFEGDHIAYIVNIDAIHSDESKKRNNPSDIDVSPVIDLIVRSAITPERPDDPIYLDLFTKSLTFPR